jgi:hypothetical protein
MALQHAAPDVAFHGPFSSSSYAIGNAPTLILRKGFLNS